jgi:hypothetical protein
MYALSLSMRANWLIYVKRYERNKENLSLVYKTIRAATSPAETADNKEIFPSRRPPGLEATKNSVETSNSRNSSYA